MSRKLVLLAAFIVVLVGASCAAFNVQRVKASGTIYIRADGSIDPPTAPIKQDGDIYTFTDNVYETIMVERSNITIDGNGYTLQGSGSGDGFYLSDINNVTVTQTNIKGFDPLWYGIIVLRSFNISICVNNITNNSHYGIGLFSSHNNSIYDNDITDNDRGIGLYSSHNNFVVGNNFANNVYGIRLGYSSDNMFYHNNFINNEVQVYDEYIPKSINVWDNSYPSGGNYWSDYTGDDSNHDGIGDTPHIIDENNTDNYPLIGMFYSYDVFWIYPGFTVTLVSNSTVSNFDVWVWIEHPENRIISFNVTGEIGYGFCRLCIPKDLMAPPYTVIIDNGQTLVLHYNETVFDNSSNRWIYFAYQHSEHQVTIVPEFPSLLIPTLFMVATLITVILYRTKHSM